ncbi:MAG TPA: hypothetical protein VEK08_15545 [Planctomycetota bacterium]|nr:hypothetical protein [Planctomycetota bacterium]
METAPETSANSNPEPLQFDKAEIQSLTCSTCNTAIADQYYKIDQKDVCVSCKDRVAELMTGGSGTNRFIKAAIYGSIAGVFGAGIYWAVLYFLNLQFGLISILVGFMVGAAVKAGSEQRGGLAYQLLAVFITYTAIVSAYVPMLVAGIMELNEKRAATAKAEPPAARSAQSAEKAAATPVAAPAPAAQQVDTAIESDEPDEPLTFGGFVLGVLVLIGVVYALPFLAGFQNIIGIAIIAFGLYQAWSMNTKMQSAIRGPFFVNQKPVQEPTSA